MCVPNVFSGSPNLVPTKRRGVGWFAGGLACPHEGSSGSLGASAGPLRQWLGQPCCFPGRIPNQVHRPSEACLCQGEEKTGGWWLRGEKSSAARGPRTPSSHDACVRPVSSLQNFAVRMCAPVEVRTNGFSTEDKSMCRNHKHCIAASNSRARQLESVVGRWTTDILTKCSLLRCSCQLKNKTTQSKSSCICIF